MSRSNILESSSLALIFLNQNMPGLSLTGSVSSGSLYVGLHTSDPGEAGTQSTGEAAYTNYARVAVPRSASYWNVSASQVSNLLPITFPSGGATTASVTFWSIGTGSAGTGQLLYSGPISSVAVGFALGEASDDTLTIKNHALAVDDRISLFAIGNLALPSTIVEGTIYFVKTVPTVDTITIASTAGGATFDITVDGQGICYKVTPFLVTTGITPEFGINALQILED